MVLIPPKSTFNASSPWLSCDACPNPASRSISQGGWPAKGNAAWCAWYCQEACTVSKGRPMSKDKPGSMGDHSTGGIVFSLTVVQSHSTWVAPGWWQWQVLLAAQWSQGRWGGKTQDQIQPNSKFGLARTGLGVGKPAAWRCLSLNWASGPLSNGYVGAGPRSGWSWPLRAVGAFSAWTDALMRARHSCQWHVFYCARRPSGLCKTAWWRKCYQVCVRNSRASFQEAKLQVMSVHQAKARQSPTFHSPRGRPRNQLSCDRRSCRLLPICVPRGPRVKLCVVAVGDPLPSSSHCYPLLPVLSTVSAHLSGKRYAELAEAFFVKEAGKSMCVFI